MFSFLKNTLEGTACLEMTKNKYINWSSNIYLDFSSYVVDENLNSLYV